MVLPKSILFALAAIPCVLAAVASPRAPDLDLDDGMTWTGRIFKTDTEVTELHGTATEILAQILAINPEYNAAEIAPEDALEALEKRAEVLTCGTMATGDLDRSITAANDLKKLGQNCGAPSKRCRRMTCQSTTASYICSENSSDVSIPCSTAGRQVNHIILNCCRGYRAGRSGHIYQDGRYSIWLGYGNCNHATNVFPHTYPYPGGNVNGGCYND
ncbi:hypothetical protein QC764_606200 [Podospora pseudoanserina]|uniref:Uncharacterized protein n=1 Tax=Podospora pseudoanserina TaxID=2609844 RepID=A0ABR0HU97_9PEZI|nr:hypothetical protein QC764_606200 [Podospora pseudoanserina]